MSTNLYDGIKAGLQALGLKTIITSEGVWRIRREESSPIIEVFKYELSGHGDILSPEFIEWRNRVPNTKDAVLTSPDAKDSNPKNADSDIKSDIMTS